MKQEILILIDDVLKIMNEVENDIFTKHRAKYAYSKTILDNYREEIEEIRQELNNNLSEQSAIELKNEINSMSQSVLEAKENGIVSPVTNVETLDSTISTMINDLDSNAPETVLPTANIDVQAIENTIPNLETIAQTQNMEDTELMSSLQVQPTATEEVLIDNAFTQIPIEPQMQAGVEQVLTADIIINDNQQDQMLAMTPAVEIPAIEPMIEIPDIEIPNTTPMTDITQETEA